MKNGIFLPADAVKEAMRFVVENDIRFALEGLWVDTSTENRPIIEATDGHRLHRIQIDNTSIVPVDSEKAITDAEMTNPTSITLLKAEVVDILFKLSEIKAVTKLHKRKNDEYMVVLTIKIMKERILFKASGKVLTRYIKPETKVPEKLVGLEFGINQGYLMQALECYPNTAINIAITDGMSPILIRPIDAEYPLHVLMPVKIYGKVS